MLLDFRGEFFDFCLEVAVAVAQGAALALLRQQGGLLLLALAADLLALGPQLLELGLHLRAVAGKLANRLYAQRFRKVGQRLAKLLGQKLALGFRVDTLRNHRRQLGVDNRSDCVEQLGGNIGRRDRRSRSIGCGLLYGFRLWGRAFEIVEINVGRSVGTAEHATQKSGYCHCDEDFKPQSYKKIRQPRKVFFIN